MRIGRKAFGLKRPLIHAGYQEHDFPNVPNKSFTFGEAAIGVRAEGLKNEWGEEVSG